MKIITDDACTGYSQSGHPEKPARIARTAEKLRAQTELPITWAKPGPVDDAAILRAHAPELLANLNSAQDFDEDTPAYPGIANYALASAGAALEAMRSARNGESVFSLMRPPGHHATHNRIMGFCYLNNIAIAALDALAHGVKRVAVFDFDVHHGNGTEDIFLNTEDAAFFSIHQFPAYPGTGRNNVGDNCFNYPVPPALPRAEYRDVFSSALEQLKKFKPDLVGISAGFDAYARDPLAEETLEAEDFYWLGKQIRALSLPTFSILEGGYSRDLPELVFAYLKGLDGK
ncbi:MAG TPA: histone deacetylase [Verrucomicrobiae bacterium]|jgi:acetoin utilization deacetylase AcuC-like enzyme|nr:histone deacetylase [Verrucomicrobiae bacterium]